MRVCFGLVSFFFCLLGVSFTLYTQAFSLASAVPVRTQGNRFVADTQNLWIQGLNYYPQKTPWSLFWSQYDAAVIDADLARVREMGFNTVRIFLPYPQFQPPFSETHSALNHLQHFLGRAEAHQLRCVVTLFDFYQDYRQPEVAAQYLRNFLPRFQGHPAILAWDVKNELDRDVDAVGAVVLQRWLDTVLPALKSADTTHLSTVGWSTPEAVLNWRTAVDYDTFHYYGRPEDFSTRVQALQAQRKLAGLQRPLVMGEFGYHTWAQAKVDPHFLEHQYNYVNAMMAGRLSEGLAGSLFWNLYDYAPSLREPWVLQSPSFQYHMGLLDVQGRPKPALQALQQAVFLRDADTLGEPTLQSKALELVCWVVEPGTVSLVRMKEGQRAPLKTWTVQPGLQRLRLELTASEIEDLIYLRSRYHVTTPDLRNLAGQVLALQDHPLTLRLR